MLVTYWSGASLDMVRVDTSSLVRYLSRHGKHRPPLQERVESEFRSYRLFLPERLEVLVIQLETERAKFKEDCRNPF